MLQTVAARWSSLCASLTLLFLVVVVPLILFGEIAEEVKEGETLALDHAILHALHVYHSPFFDRIFVAIARWGGAWGLIPATFILAAFLFARRNYRAMLFCLASVFGSILLNLAAKQFFGRARPDLWISITPLRDFSFPSGHAMLSTAFFSALIVLFWPTRARWPVLVVGIVGIGLVCLSRLYLGVHFPTDVAAGVIASLGWTGGLARLFHSKIQFSDLQKWRWR